MDLLCEPISPAGTPPPTSPADMRTDSERALRMTHRKFNKHMAEKRRRARINQALEQMKTMVLCGMQKDPEHYDKMEKADILDLTVKYVTTVVSESPELSAALAGKKFRAGYTEALKECDQFLNTVAMETSAKSRLVGHLTTQAQPHSASHVHALVQLEGERLAFEEAARRRESGMVSSSTSRQAAPTAVVAPVHVVAPHSHVISRASVSGVAAPSAVAGGSCGPSGERYMDSQLKQHHQAAADHAHRRYAADMACLPVPPPPPHLLAHAASHPNMARPVPIDLRHKYFQVADRCVPVPMYDSMWRPWDRPVSV